MEDCIWLRKGRQCLSRSRRAGSAIAKALIWEVGANHDASEVGVATQPLSVSRIEATGSTAEVTSTLGTVRALLFDQDEVEEVEDWKERVEHLGRKSILWVDLDTPEPGELKELVEAFKLARETAEEFVSEDVEPFFGEFGSYLHVTVFVPASEDRRTELVRVTCLVAERWVVTLHEASVQPFEDFRKRAGGSGQVGLLDGPLVPCRPSGVGLGCIPVGFRSSRARSRGVRHTSDEG